MPERPRPAPFSVFAGDDPARSGLGAGGRFVQATIGVAAWSSAPSQHRGGSEGHPWMAMSSGGHLRVRPVDPRDTAWEVNAPAYRVYFWLQPPGPLRLAKSRWPGFPTNMRSRTPTWPSSSSGPTPRHPLARPSRCTRWPTATACPASSGSLVPTQRHRAVMSDSCPPSSFAITSLDGLGQGSALPCPAGRSVPGRGGPERRRRPRPDGTGPSSTRARTSRPVTDQLRPGRRIGG
jgi:hypothetical protein